jgi:hypothetical protein
MMARWARSILKLLCPKPLASPRTIRGFAKRLGAGRRERGLGLGLAPGLVGDAAEGKARLRDLSPSSSRPAATETRAKA